MFKLTHEQFGAIRSASPSETVCPISGDAYMAIRDLAAKRVAETGRLIGLTPEEYDIALAEVDKTMRWLRDAFAEEAADKAAREAEAEAHREEVLDLLVKHFPDTDRAHMLAVMLRFGKGEMRVTDGCLDDGYGDGAVERFAGDLEYVARKG
jgi:hypothetical protein